MAMTTPTSPRALYVHVPFCRSRCGYCDFYSAVFEPQLAAPLVDALLTELARANAAQSLAVETVFVGGGTPTVLPPAQLSRLLRACTQLSARRRAAEFTVEANPATVAPSVAEVLVESGVNRVSIGAQSFHPAELHVLERTHDPGQIASTIGTCREYGIRRFNLDLIFGIPGQTLATWEVSLRAAMNLGVEHLSCYGLTYEPGTRLHDLRQRGQVAPLDPDLEADMYEAALDLLAAGGYEQYEISNFARPGGQCRHNLVYWHNQPYLGIGPSAAGYVDGVRYQNVANTDLYIEMVSAGRTPRGQEERLEPQRRACETAMLALRLNAGLLRRPFAECFGRDPLGFFAEAIARHRPDGLVEVTDAAVRLTRAGRMLADTVIADFLACGQALDEAGRRTRA